MRSQWSRRDFVRLAGAVPALSLIRDPWRLRAEPWFRISLAEWSLHRALQAGSVDHFDFPIIARRDYGIEGVEYVSPFFDGRIGPRDLADLHTRADDHGVKSVLIMCDNEGELGDPDGAARTRAVENHYKWVEAAAALGCHSIRVNARSAGTPDEQRALAVDGLQRLTAFAADKGINVIVENHGGLSSNGTWLTGVIKAVGHPRCGTLPDFGNFRVSDTETYDRYQGVKEMMPFAKGVSAKSHAFAADGTETETDYRRMLTIVRDAGYRGWVGIEYEGDDLSEPDGIRATLALLERLRPELAPPS